jgi:hypothetical protein
MPVIINEFEVIAEPPPPPGGRSAPQLEGQRQEASPLRALDIVAIQERHQQRMARLEAE